MAKPSNPWLVYTWSSTLSLSMCASVHLCTVVRTGPQLTDKYGANPPCTTDRIRCFQYGMESHQLPRADSGAVVGRGSSPPYQLLEVFLALKTFARDQSQCTILRQCNSSDIPQSEARGTFQSPMPTSVKLEIWD